jgi:hypothetical protein
MLYFYLQKPLKRSSLTSDQRQCLQTPLRVSPRLRSSLLGSTHSGKILDVVQEGADVRTEFLMQHIDFSRTSAYSTEYSIYSAVSASNSRSIRLLQPNNKNAPAPSKSM